MVIGIDLSSKGLAYVDLGVQGEVLWEQECVVKGKLATDRFHQLMMIHRQVMAERHPEFVAIEGLAYMASPKTLSALAQVLGGLRATTAWYWDGGSVRMEPAVVKGAEWKKNLGVSGRANKDQVREAVEARGFVGRSEDLNDAWGVAWWGVLRGRQR